MRHCRRGFDWGGGGTIGRRCSAMAALVLGYGDQGGRAGHFFIPCRHPLHFPHEPSHTESISQPPRREARGRRELRQHGGSRGAVGWPARCACQVGPASQSEKHARVKHSWWVGPRAVSDRGLACAQRLTTALHMSARGRGWLCGRVGLVGRLELNSAYTTIFSFILFYFYFLILFSFSFESPIWIWILSWVSPLSQMYKFKS